MLISVTEFLSALPGQPRFKWMAWRPPNLAGKPIRTTAEGADRRREEERLSDRDHFGLKALLRRLIPESRKVRRSDRPGEYLRASALEGGDLRSKIVAERLKTSGVDQLVEPASCRAAGKPRLASAQEFPEISLGKSAPTTLFVSTDFQRAKKDAITSSTPQKKWYVQVKPLSGVPCRPKK